jgi:hypothetical protein
MELPRLANPCHEDFKKMPAAGNGRFCASCCKVVVDFTKKTTAEIFEYIKSHGSGCGLFRPSQLQQATLPATQKFSWRLKRFSVALYLVFGSLLFSLASCGGGYVKPPYNRIEDSIYQSQVNAQQKLQDSLRQDSINRDALTPDSTGGRRKI